jgi:hypothetical protein
MGDRPILTVTIDTEEDNWGSYEPDGATTANIAHLRELHGRMAALGAHVTYLVNRPPLLAAESVAVLGDLAGGDEVEIGAHCHPWNTPPSTGSGPERSMMATLPLDANRGKVAEITRRIESELGVRPRSFRAGRWGFGPTVAAALAAEGYRIDASVSPFVDWTPDGGPDFLEAPFRPYRFHPERPLEPDPGGPMVEIPTTVGYLKGDPRRMARFRRSLERSFLARLKVVGLLGVSGVIQRRWLSPEHSSARDMIRLCAACLRSGQRVLDLTFHSCTLLPGATPFVRDDADRARFFRRIEDVLRFAGESGYAFGTLSEIGSALFDTESGAARTSLSRTS